MSHQPALLWKWAIVLLALVLPISGISEQRRIVMAYEEFPPYSFTDTHGHARGYSIDILDQIAKDAGYNVTHLPSVNPGNSIEMLARGQVDMTTLLALIPERLEIGLPTTALGAYEMRAFVLTESATRTPDALSGRRIGVVGGTFAVEGAKKIPFAEVVEYARPDNMIIPLLNGDIDAAVSNSDSFKGRLRKADVEHRIRQLETPLVSSPYGFIVAQDRPDIQAFINGAIDTSFSSGQMASLHERWFGRPKTLLDSRLFWWMLVAASLAAIAFVSMGRWAHFHKKTSERLSKDSEANHLLIDALNQVTGAIVIYDSAMHAVHWNRGFESGFPHLIQDAEQGRTMRQLIARSYKNDMVMPVPLQPDIEEHIDLIIRDVKAGSSEIRTVRTTDGRVFEARDFKLGANHFASTRVDVTRLQAQQDTIELQAERLSIANDQLQVFASIAAHDLRAPLSQQQGLLDMIAEDLTNAKVKLPDDTIANWNLMVGLSQRMMNLIQDLLEFARADNIHDAPAVLHPSEHLPTVAELTAQKQGISLSIQDDMPPVRVNPTAFETVMRNLISNAIKHHDKDDGLVQIHADEAGDFVEIHVTDDGPGIPKQFHDRIFKPFERLSNAEGGSGLGLAYIQKAVVDWGGQVSVSSAAPCGSRFTITVPRDPQG